MDKQNNNEINIEANNEVQKSDVNEKIKKSLRYSIYDGALHSSMVGFGESFLSAYAVFLQATSVQIAMLGSLPQAFGAVMELNSRRLTELFKSRKKFVCVGAFLEALSYLPIALVYFFGTFRTWHLIFFATLYWVFGKIISPAWSSWMGDLVSEKERGAYFGVRNKIAGFVSFVCVLLGGYLLQRFKLGGYEYLGFVLIFTIALASRLGSFLFLIQKYEPEYEIKPQYYFSFVDFVKQARFNNYGMFVIFLCLMNFSVYIAAPFFAPYMLNELKWSYWTFTIVNATTMIVKFVAMPVWGRLSDRFGTIKVLTLTAFIMPVVPILWLFSKEVYWILLIQVYAGFVWAGFEISSFNFIFDCTSPQKRQICVAYFHVLNGIAVFLGAIVGAFFIKYALDYIPVFAAKYFLSVYYIVFLLSGIFRYVTTLLLVPKLKEMRKVEPISYKDLLMQVMYIGPGNIGIVHRLLTFNGYRKKKEKTDSQDLKERDKGI